jgi:SAM-dependent methyltransferase
VSAIVVHSENNRLKIGELRKPFILKTCVALKKELKQKNLGNYVSFYYSDDDNSSEPVRYRPDSGYPDLLAIYLSEKFCLKKGSKLLDIGCGRGDFLRAFIRYGMVGYGLDRSLAAKQTCPDAEILQADLENEQLPYDDNTFDCIFSKSVLEHFYFPENLVQEIHRVLKPGGTVITMVPDWQSQHRNVFYRDFTHRTPFIPSSLRDIFLLMGFSDVKVERFTQLPIVWKWPMLKILTSVLALLTPDFLSDHSKFIKFSKELMLLGYAVKKNDLVTKDQ